MKRNRHSREQWAEWLEEQPGSGLSVEAFCRSKQVSTNSFYLWRRKLTQEKSSVGNRHPFVGLALVETETTFEIELPGGAKIQVPGDEVSLRRILSIVWELGGPQ